MQDTDWLDQHFIILFLLDYHEIPLLLSVAAVTGPCDVIITCP